MLLLIGYADIFANSSLGRHVQRALDSMKPKVHTGILDWGTMAEHLDIEEEGVNSPPMRKSPVSTSSSLNFLQELFSSVSFLNFFFARSFFPLS